MKQKVECSYVRDLLPLYIEGLVSDETKRQIGEHLEKCESCRTIYENMKTEVIGVEQENRDSEKNFLKLIKKNFILTAINVLLGLAVLICFIVNLAVNHGFTWFPTAAVSILYAGVIINTFVTSAQHKVFNSMISISVGLVVLLTTIQASAYYLLGDTDVWYFKFGLPLALLWLSIVWIPVLLNRFCRVRVWDAIAILFIGTLAGNYATKMLLGDITSMDGLLDKTLFLQNGLGNLVGAIICLLIGRIRKWKK